MNEELEVIKATYNMADDLSDIYKNPLAKILMSFLPVFPQLSVLIDTSIDKALSDFQKKKEKALIDFILKERDITSNQVNDIEFIINFSKIIEAVRRLTTNDKVEYYGNLLRNGYLSNERIEGDFFDECYEKIGSMSYREIVLLWKYSNFSGQGLGDVEKWDSFKKALSKEIDVDEEVIVNIFTSLTRTGFVKQLNVLFPDGQKENPFVLTKLYFKFCEYVMKD